MMKRLFGFALAFVFATSSFAMRVDSVSPFGSHGSVKLVVDIDGGAALNQLDLLFVVDDSRSMEEHQARLAAFVPTLADGLKNALLNVQAGVFSTSTSGYDGKVFGGRLVDGFVTNSDAQFKTELTRRVLLGTYGDSEEKPFGSLVAGLTEPNLSTFNKGFFRPTAQLLVVFLTDGEDGSDLSATAVKAALTGLKGRDFSLLAAHVPSLDKSCDRRGEYEPKKIEELLSLTGGTSISLCDADLDQKILNAIMASVPSTQPPVLNRTIKLPAAPVLASVRVTYAGKEIVFGDSYAGWVFDSSKSAIVIGEGFQFNVAGVRKLEITYDLAAWP